MATNRQLPSTHPGDGHSVDAALTAIYSWNYEPEIDELRTLYANGLDRQWIALRDLVPLTSVGRYLTQNQETITHDQLVTGRLVVWRSRCDPPNANRDSAHRRGTRRRVRRL